MKYGVEAAAVLPLILAASFRARWQLRTGQRQGRTDASERASVEDADVFPAGRQAFNWSNESASSSCKHVITAPEKQR